MALVDRDTQLKPRLPQVTGTSRDAVLDDLIGVVDGLFAQFCGYPVASSATLPTMESSTYVLRLDGPRYREPRALDLGIRPVSSVTSVYVDSTWSFPSSSEYVEGTDFELDGDAGVLWLLPTSSDGWTRAPRAIKATVVAGWTTLADDHPLVELVAQTVKHLLDAPHVRGKRSISVSGQTVQPDDLDDLLPAAVRARLAPFVVNWGAYVG